MKYLVFLKRKWNRLKFQILKRATFWALKQEKSTPFTKWYLVVVITLISYATPILLFLLVFIAFVLTQQLLRLW